MAAAFRASTLVLISAATRCDTLPSRNVLRVPSPATKRIRRWPLGSLLILAIVLLPFLPPALAGRNMQVEQVRQGVEVLHRQAALPGHEPAYRGFGEAQLFRDAVAGKSAGIDRPANFVAQLDALLAHAPDPTQYFD